MSKFKNILDAAKQPEDKKTTDKKAKAIPESDTQNLSQESPPIKKGRPKGKRSNPDFEQVTAYIRSQTYRQTKIALLQQDELSDFSELIEELLTEWLSTQKGES